MLGIVYSTFVNPRIGVSVQWKRSAIAASRLEITRPIATATTVRRKCWPVRCQISSVWSRTQLHHTSESGPFASSFVTTSADAFADLLDGEHAEVLAVVVDDDRDVRTARHQRVERL